MGPYTKLLKDTILIITVITNTNPYVQYMSMVQHLRDDKYLDVVYQQQQQPLTSFVG